MDKKEKIIIILIIILLILLLGIILIGVLLLNNSEDNNDNTLNNVIENTTIINGEDINNNNNDEFDVNEIDTELYVKAKDVVDTYFKYVNKSKTGVLTLLDEQYLKEYEIKKKELEIYLTTGGELTTIADSFISQNQNAVDKIYQELDIVDGNIPFHTMKNVKEISIKGDLSLLEVSTLIHQNNRRKEYNLIICIDKKNNSFSIMPTGYFNKNILDIDFSNIGRCGNNVFLYNTIDNEYITKTLFDIYINSINDIQYSYGLIADDYKKLKFDSIEKYYEFINNRKNMLNNAMMLKYTVQENDEYTEYICLDQNDNYYVFNVKTMNDFNIFLDDYTILIKSDEEKYKNMKESLKAGYNVNRFIKMLQNEDYDLAYKFLNKSFRENYFNTTENFKNYIQKEISFIRKSSFTSNTVNQVNGIYTIEVDFHKQVDGLYDNEDAKSVIKTFLVKLNEGTDFELSFNVE